MKTRKELEAEWDAMSVEERIQALDAREIRPSLKAMQESFEAKRKARQLPKTDLSSSFVDAFKGQKELSRSAPTQEERDQAKFLMGHLRRCARQNLRKEQFARIEKELK